MGYSLRLRPQATPQVTAGGSNWTVVVCKPVGSAYVGSNPTPATTPATKCGNGPLAGNSRLCGPFGSASGPLSSDVLAVMPSRPSRYGT